MRGLLIGCALLLAAGCAYLPPIFGPGENGNDDSATVPPLEPPGLTAEKETATSLSAVKEQEGGLEVIR